MLDALKKYADRLRKLSPAASVVADSIAICAFTASQTVVSPPFNVMFARIAARVNKK
ncbi:hypothetical protein ACU4GI_19590 [Cupriavidus basilensis]